MSLYREYALTLSNIRETMTLVWNLVCEAVKAGEVLVIVTEISKSRAQERKYHCLINEMAQQVELNGRRYDSECWKAMLVEQFAVEKKRMGEPLAKPGRQVWSLDRERLISVRPSTTGFRKREASEFIEYLYSAGVEYGVKWSATAEDIAAAEGNGHGQQ